MKKLWLDDVRKPPYGNYIWCKTVDEAIASVQRRPFHEWALDHDLGGQLAHYGKGPYDYSAPNGTHFIAGARLKCVKIPSRITIHSTSIQGTANMMVDLYRWAVEVEQDIEIIIRPMQGRIMDKTPYYEGR